jgi:hypothetical protein
MRDRWMSPLAAGAAGAAVAGAAKAVEASSAADTATDRIFKRSPPRLNRLPAHAVFNLQFGQATAKRGEGAAAAGPDVEPSGADLSTIVFFANPFDSAAVFTLDGAYLTSRSAARRLTPPSAGSSSENPSPRKARGRMSY